MGKAISRNDKPAKVDGSAFFGLDAHSEDMLYAAIRLAPVFGSKLASVDPGDALSQRGVRRIVELEDSVAVVADNYWRAKRALATVNTEWEVTGNESVSSADIAVRFDRELADSNGNEDKEQKREGLHDRIIGPAPAENKPRRFDI